MTNRNPGVITDQYYTKLKYSQRVLISSTAGLQATQVFRGNSAYDPDVSGVGAQPVGYDELSQLYTKVRIYGSRVVVRTISQGTSNVTSQYDLALVPLLSTPTWASINDANANIFARTAMVGNSNTAPHIMRNYMSTKRIFGDRDIGSDAFEHDNSNNPSNQWYWYLTIQPLDRASSMSVIAEVSITYYAQFSGRKVLNLS